MIVCHCQGVSESVVVAAAIDADADAVPTVESVGRRCGAGTQCGGCVATLEDILAGHCPGYARCAVTGSAVPAA